MTTKGLCECGCGGKTNLAPYSYKRKGWVKGEPMRFISQHHTRLSPVEYIVDDGDCWIWQRATTLGYGVVRRDGRLQYAHRVAYEKAYGPITDDLHVHHTCRTRRCVNPDHLELMTIEEHGRLHSRDQVMATT